jgi:hypothetical protein
MKNITLLLSMLLCVLSAKGQDTLYHQGGIIYTVKNDENGQGHIIRCAVDKADGTGAYVHECTFIKKRLRKVMYIDSLPEERNMDMYFGRHRAYELNVPKAGKKNYPLYEFDNTGRALLIAEFEGINAMISADTAKCFQRKRKTVEPYWLSLGERHLDGQRALSDGQYDRQRSCFCKYDEMVVVDDSSTESGVKDLLHGFEVYFKECELSMFRQYRMGEQHGLAVHCGKRGKIKFLFMYDRDINVGRIKLGKKVRVD